MKKYYYIKSLTEKGWWKEGAVGLTNNLWEAGKWDEHDVKTYPDLYNNGKRTLAIPCEDVALKIKDNLIRVYDQSCENMSLRFDNNIIPRSYGGNKTTSSISSVGYIILEDGRKAEVQLKITTLEEEFISK